MERQILTLVLAACVLVAGCHSGSTTPKAASSPHGAQLSAPVPAGTSFVNGTATLAHIPVGTGKLTWSSSDNVVHVDINLTGVSPTSQYVASVTNGPCDNKGGLAFSVGQLTPDQNGRVSMHQDITNRPNGFPLNSALTVSAPPGPRPPVYVACGNLGNGTVGVGGSNASATTNLGPTSDASQNVTGTAYLRQIGTTLLVHVDVAGLDPNTAHNEAIHLGNCSFLSYTIYGLPTLNADGSGNASSDITINNSQPMPNTGWYVAAQYGTDPSTVYNQSVACGNIQVLLG